MEIKKDVTIKTWDGTWTYHPKVLVTPKSVEDLVEILTVNKLHYSHGSESGVLFHLIGALSEFGKLGMTAIANSYEEVDELYARTLDVLDRETQYGR